MDDIIDSALLGGASPLEGAEFPDPIVRNSWCVRVQSIRRKVRGLGLVVLDGAILVCSLEP